MKMQQHNSAGCFEFFLAFYSNLMFSRFFFARPLANSIDFNCENTLLIHSVT
jgi:hypothetical protein